MKKPGEKLMRERRKNGLTQKTLAEQVGCAPSALSMFEAGKTSALSVEKLKKISEVLHVDLDALLAEATVQFCTHPLCPTHQPYRIGKNIHFKPTGIPKGSSSNYCGWCGEVLSSECENCHAPFEPSAAFCPDCGESYVPAFEEDSLPDPDTLLQLQQLQADRKKFDFITGKEE